MNLFLARLRVLLLFMLATTPAFTQSKPPKRELRAAWIATVVNIDWPSRKGLSSFEQRAEFVALLDKLHAVGMNAVIVQVRPTADAFYPSATAPWSEYLSGTQGKHPEPWYDPLSFMIDEARKRNMEFHAWFNPYRISMNAAFDPAQGHPFCEHPEWFVTYGGKWYFDPGHPDGRAFVLDAIMETVRRYDIDAVHFDDYFYPYRIAGEEFPDDSTFMAYGAAYPSRDDWRRSNVDAFVEQLAGRIAAEKPYVKFGISPFGVWRNRDKDPRGSLTQAGQTNFDDLYADVLKWLERGWIDYVTPQIYWHIGFEKAEYKTLVDWWAANSYGRHVYIGQGIYRVGQKGWEKPNEIVDQIAYNRNTPQVSGSMFFSAKVFSSDKLNVNRRIDSLYDAKALIPVMSWKPAVPVPSPQPEIAKGSPRSGIDIQWRDEYSTPSTYYVIYRYDEGAVTDHDDSRAIVAIVPRSNHVVQQWTDTKIEKRKRYTYLITGVDRLHNESLPGKCLVIRTKGKKRTVSSDSTPASGAD